MIAPYWPFPKYINWLSGLGEIFLGGLLLFPRFR